MTLVVYVVQLFLDLQVTLAALQRDGNYPIRNNFSKSSLFQLS